MTYSTPAQTTNDYPEWLIHAYLDAKEWVLCNGFADEMEWQRQVRLDEVDEQAFLRETAWVILSAGMSEHVVSGLFGALSKAFLDWKDGSRIVAQRESCRSSALAAFRHVGKVDAILSAAERVAAAGFIAVKEAIRRDGESFLETFDYIGPVTKYHLGKNLGLELVKPDRHLVRLANASGMASPHVLCSVISDATGDRLSVVDLVLWRYAASTAGYLRAFAPPTQVV